ncbi:MAG: biopolymer transporter ExbD [Pseudomonadota bacterium]
MRRHRQARREPTIALINIVFLLLVFFLISGTLARPLESDLTLVETESLPPTGLPDALVVHADGRMSYRGAEIASAAAYLAAAPPDATLSTRLVPDRALPATTLIRLGRDLRAAGVETVLIVTERGRP